MRKLFLFLFLISNVIANEAVFSELLEKVKQGYKSQTIEERQREQRFLNDVRKQQSMVNSIKNDIKKAKVLSEKLKNDILKNEETLQKLSNKLELSTGDLGELFGTVKQISSDMNVHIKNSLVSSQYPQRVEELKLLSDKTVLPDIKELERLWYIILQEIVESGKIVKYNTPVITGEELKDQTEIVRIGNFNAIIEGGFLQYESSNKIFVKPSYQADRGYLSTINDYIKSEDNIAEVVVDPTRGTILEMFSHKPTLKERVDQGGVIGYIIISLAVIGILFALGKYIWLFIVDLKVGKQLKDTTAANRKIPWGGLFMLMRQTTSYRLMILNIKSMKHSLKRSRPCRADFP